MASAHFGKPASVKALAIRRQKRAQVFKSQYGDWIRSRARPIQQFCAMPEHDGTVPIGFVSCEQSPGQFAKAAAANLRVPQSSRPIAVNRDRLFIHAFNFARLPYANFRIKRDAVRGIAAAVDCDLIGSQRT